MITLFGAAQTRVVNCPAANSATKSSVRYRFIANKIALHGKSSQNAPRSARLERWPQER
jgi:hypothetical protein